MNRIEAAWGKSLGVIVLSVLALSSCAAEPSAGLHFARTSAKIAQPVEDAYAANFIFVADSGHKIFREYDGISIEGIGTLDETEAPLSPGETRDGQTLANIEPEIPLDMAPFEFSEITVHFKDGTTQRVDVGSWSFVPVEPGVTRPQVASWPAAIPDCAPLALELLDYPALERQPALKTDQPGVSLGPSSAVDLGPSGETRIVLDLTCNTDFDFFVISATLESTSADGANSSAILDPIMVGHIDISDEDVARISSR